MGAGESQRKLLAEDPGLVPRIHKGGLQPPVIPAPGHLMLSPGLCKHPYDTHSTLADMQIIHVHK